MGFAFVPHSETHVAIELPLRDTIAANLMSSASVRRKEGHKD